MHTISWDEEIKLIDCIFYDIDPEQDFTAVKLDGQPITEMSTASIIDCLDIMEKLPIYGNHFIFEDNFVCPIKEKDTNRLNPNNFVFEEWSELCTKDQQCEEDW